MDFDSGEVLYFDKPLEWTSFQVVSKVRYEICHSLGRKSKSLKVGHAGTLDPKATGVLILCTGKATKQIDSLQYQSKEYIADLFLGATTASFDTEQPVDCMYPTEHITRELVEQALKSFIGTIEQVPPAYSAVKVNGRRAYEMARNGEDVELKKKTLVIDSIEILDFSLPLLRIKVICSKGTYIRALARDIGVALNSGAYLTALRRTRIGDVKVEDCMQVEDFLASISAVKENISK